jgi:hypothetical protein
MTIGATTPRNGSFVDLSVTGTTSFDGSQGTAGQVLTSAGTGATPTWTTPTTGTVTSVSGTSPVASTGGATPAISLEANYGDTQNPYASKTANYVLAAPNGSAGVPTFRAIVAADIPTLNQNTTGTASNVTGTVAIANGGTGNTTRQEAMDALAGAVTSGSYLRGNGTDVVMSTIQAADVPTLNQNTTGTASNVTGTVAVANGGTGITSFGTGVATWLGTPSSANLASAITDETGSGALVFGTSPTLTTPTINSAQVATVSGTAPLYMCRAWVNFNGTGTVSVRGSGNVTSITDNGTGDYTVNFTTAMPDANYATTALSSGKSGTEATGIISIEWTTVPSTTVVRISTINRSAGAATDNTYNNVAIFR